MDTIKPYPAPMPEIQYLKALLRKIKEGKLRIPAFQRNLVWDENQILDLLESILKGYPIGSLLFWQVESKILDVQTEPEIPFPNVKEVYPLSYVLDGLQRLSTLYGVFNADKKIETRFNIVFDLRDHIFRHFTKDTATDSMVYLSDLLSPKGLIETQSGLAKLQDGDQLIDTSIQLQTAFQEYMIPTVTITDREIKDVVAMFHRINSTGTRLSAVDFMRALTWSPKFDLNQEIANLQKEFDTRNFSIEPETFVKIIAIMDGKQPNPTAMLELRDSKPEALHRATQLTKDSLNRTINYLHDKLNIQSSDFVAYETQSLMLAEYFRTSSSAANLENLTRWFLTTSFNEELRGKSDVYVSNLLKAISLNRAAGKSSLDLRLKLSVDDLLEKKFIRGKALSAGFACLFAASRSRSLLTGALISPDEYMREFDAVNFVGLFALNQLKDVKNNQSSNKIIANVVLSSSIEASEIAKQGGKTILEKALSLKDCEEVLSSQFISQKAAEVGAQGQVESFLKLRAECLRQAIQRFCETGNPLLDS